MSDIPGEKEIQLVKNSDADVKRVSVRADWQESLVQKTLGNELHLGSDSKEGHPFQVVQALLCRFVISFSRFLNGDEGCEQLKAATIFFPSQASRKLVPCLNDLQCRTSRQIAGDRRLDVDAHHGILDLRASDSSQINRRQFLQNVQALAPATGSAASQQG